MRDTTTHGLIFTRPLPQGSAPPASGAFWTDEYGWLVSVEMDIDEIVRELAGCVLHGSWGTGCDFDYAEARAIILRIGGSDAHT